MKKLFESTFNDFKNQSGIYMIKIGFRLYIGSSINIKNRLSNHKTSLKNLKHNNDFMQKCFNKHGKDNCYVSILELCSKSELLIKEKLWIEKIHPDLNLIKDPTINTNCITTSKRVYRYSLSGEFIDEYPSVSEAGRILNLDANSISQCASGKLFLKSYKKFLWSYSKYPRLPKYQNNSSLAKIKAVTMFDKDGKRIKRFDSIADAARFIMVEGENFSSLCSKISSVANNKGILVNNKFMFSYKDQDIKTLDLKRNYQVIQILDDGSRILWDSAIIAAKTLKGKPGGIHKVLRGERKKYLSSRWEKLV